MNPYQATVIGVGLGTLITIAMMLGRIADALEKKNESTDEAKLEDKPEEKKEVPMR
jgi:hypothetical protein